MSSFPETSHTLLEKASQQNSSHAEAAWQRLLELYTPALRQFVVWKGGGGNTDDIVQQVLIKLVDALRSGQYKAEKGRFHSYLAMMAYNEVHMQRRKDLVRRADDHLPISNYIDEGTSSSDDQPKTSTPEELQITDSSAGESLDKDWQRALVATARNHVLTRTALSDRDRKIYQQYALEERPIEEVAQAFGISRNLVSKIRSRIDQRIVSIGREMAKLSDDL